MYDLTKNYIDRMHVYYQSLKDFHGDYYAKGRLISEIFRCSKCQMPIEECYCGKACVCYAHMEDASGHNLGECFLNRRSMNIGIPFLEEGHLSRIEKIQINGNQFHNYLVNKQGMTMFYQRIGVNMPYNFDEVVRRWISEALEATTGNIVFKRSMI